MGRTLATASAIFVKRLTDPAQSALRLASLADRRSMRVVASAVATVSLQLQRACCDQPALRDARRS
jgi:hypothetical protein